MTQEDFLPEFDFNDQPPGSAEEGGEANEPKLELAEDADPNVVAAYQYYKEQGLITNDSPFDGTLDSMYQVMQKEDELRDERIFTQIVGYVPDFARDLTQLLLAKGADLTKEELIGFFDLLREPEVTTESLQQEDVAEQYLLKYYTTVKKEDEDTAKELIGLLKGKNKLSAEAKFIFEQDALIKGKQVQTKVDAAKQNRQDTKATAAKFESEFLEGIKAQNWQKPKMQQVYNEFYSGAFKTKLDEVLSDPKNLLVLVDLMSKYDPAKKEFDVEGWKKQVTSKDVKKAGDVLRNYWGSTGTRGGVATGTSPNNNTEFEFA